VSENTDQKLLSAPEAACRIGLAPATLAKLRTCGGGPPFLRLGARVLYPLSLLDRWIDEQPILQSTSDGDERRRRPNAGRPPNGTK